MKWIDTAEAPGALTTHLTGPHVYNAFVTGGPTLAHHPATSGCAAPLARAGAR